MEDGDLSANTNQTPSGSETGKFFNGNRGHVPYEMYWFQW